MSLTIDELKVWASEYREEMERLHDGLHHDKAEKGFLLCGLLIEKMRSIEFWQSKYNEKKAKIKAMREMGHTAEVLLGRLETTIVECRVAISRMAHELSTEQDPQEAPAASE